MDKMVSLVPAGSFVLDAGCGSGIVPFLLSKNNSCTGVGIDIRKECTEFAEVRVQGFKFYPADIKNFSLPERFDVVICMEVLEHFSPEDREKVIDRLDAHLKPGGILILSFPSRLYFFIEPFWKVLRKRLHREMIFDDDEYHALISPSAEIGLFKKRGYRPDYSSITGLGLIKLLAVRKN
jgi:SAM-dependent methyltransferase